MTRVLVVDDEPQIVRALSTNLRARDYEVLAAPSGEDAIRMVEQQVPDLVILDIGLPGINGIDVVTSLRTWTSVPIIMLSVRGAEADKVAALDAGADDFVTKPFAMNELLARLRSALRRSASTDADPVVTTPDFTIDLRSKTVRHDDDRIRLTPTEWSILELLVRNPGKLISQRQVLSEVWGPGYETETNYLRVYLANLRRKLEPVPSQPRYLITEPGLGYRFEVPRR